MLLESFDELFRPFHIYVRLKNTPQVIWAVFDIQRYLSNTLNKTFTRYAFYCTYIGICMTVHILRYRNVGFGTKNLRKK